MIQHLETERLRLCQLQSIDAELVAEYYLRNREFHAPWTPVRPESYYSTKYWGARLHADQKLFRDGQALHLYLLSKDQRLQPDQCDNKPTILGQISFTQIGPGVFRACYLGFGLDQNAQGKGYMREALTPAILDLTDRFDLNRIMANYRPENLRSGRLLKHLGFEVEGYARRYLKIAGAWRDHILTALHRETINRLKNQ